MLLAVAALIIVAYLIGSFPYMLLLGRAKGIDLTHEPDSHQALWYKVGRLEGLSGIVIDMLKGVIAVLLGFWFSFPLAVVAAAGIAAVIGQMWPIFEKFDGEKGNTTGIGVVITMTMWLTANGEPLAYWVFIIFAIPILTGAGIRNVPKIMAKGQTMSQRFTFAGPYSNSMPLGMLVGFAIAPLSSWLLHMPMEMTLGFAAIFVVLIIRRLTASLRADLKPGVKLGTILLNRFLYDRSYL